ncbi:MAG: glycosyltransferase family 2 protein [bacterium]
MFEEIESTPQENWPKLSIIISARNEAVSINQSITTLLKQDYPNFEIILIDDRSTDQTGEIIDSLAKSDARIHPISIKELPDRWLGKVHALHTGMQMVGGDWLLFTDADVNFAQGILKKAVSHVINNNIDYFAMLPKVNTNSFLMEILIRTFGMSLLLYTKALYVGKPGSKAFIGIGAFNLVKKTAFDKTEGFEWLRMEIGDDYGLGLMMHHSGAKSGFALALKDMNVTWYASIKDMIIGSEKGGALISLKKAVVMAITAAALISAPITALLYIKISHIWIFGVISFIFLIAAAAVGKSRYKNGFFPSLFIPVGQLIFVLMGLRSVILCKLRGGVIWRGTKYPAEQIYNHQRVKF